MANRAETPRVIITVPSPIKQTMDRTFGIVRCMVFMVYLPILKSMRLVSEEEAVGRNAMELAEDQNHARKHYGRDGANPPTLTPKKAILCFCGGNPRSEKPRPD